MKIGFIDVGGGMRGIYAAGVLDYCMDQGIQFDVGIGVSAGSANLVSYAAGQPRRNHTFYTQYSRRKEYSGIGCFFKKGNFVDLDYIYGTLSNSDGEYPVDYKALASNPMEMMIVATEADTGHAKYFTKADIHQDGYDVCKASSAIPFACKPYPIEGIPYYDGAGSDPIPIQKAFDMGCDKVVLILTRPTSVPRSARKDSLLAAMIQRRYPEAAKGLRKRANRYNLTVMEARGWEMQGKLLIVAPEDTCGVTTLSGKWYDLERLYEQGYRDAGNIPLFLASETN